MKAKKEVTLQCDTELECVLKIKMGKGIVSLLSINNYYKHIMIRDYLSLKDKNKLLNVLYALKAILDKELNCTIVLDTETLTITICGAYSMAIDENSISFYKIK